LKYGADLHARTSDGVYTPLDEALGRGHRRAARLLYLAVAKHHPEAYGTPLHAAANIGDAVLVEDLIASGAEVNGRDYELKTPLHWAVGKRQPLLAQLILEFHKVERISPAVQLSPEESVKVLVRHGAELEAKDAYGYTPLLTAGHWRQDASARLLIEAGADVNTRDDTGWTPLMSGKSIRTLELLIARGADLTATRHGWDALAYAVHQRRREGVEFLIAHGLSVNPAGGSTQTPLHTAALLGYRDMVALLLAHGADPEARNEQGRTPLDLAKSRKFMGIVRMLTRPASSPSD
jgi:ankyrin repeat protein